MSLTLRPGIADDAAECGRICFEAFTAISRQHNFPPDFPNVEAPTGLMRMMLARPDVHSVIAERGGRIVGSNFLWEGNGAVAGVGPITIDPNGAQNAGAGKALMTAVIDRARQRKIPGVRLVQAAFHSRSLSLYAKLGFNIVEPLACMHGKPSGDPVAGRIVRPATIGDIDACNALCWSIHGHSRAGDLRDGIAHTSASVVEHDGRITGYASGIGFFGHAVGETNADIQALIASAGEISGPGMLVPTRNTELFRWCLARGFRVTQPLTLMALGLYQEPRGAFLPSILY